ncbi:MAG: HNH endonuclease [Streptosporangiaceae bacterium]
MAGAWKWPPGWKALGAATFKRYGHVCWSCGAYASTVDHLTPVALGGTHDLSNLRPACTRCNYSRGGQLASSRLTAAQRRAIARKASAARARPTAPGWSPSRVW